MGNKFKEIKKKICKLQNKEKFKEAIELIETIPEDERDLEIRVYHAKMFNDIAIITIGDFDENNENSQTVLYLQKAINLLERIKEEGKDDSFWNERIASSYYNLGHILVNKSFHYYSLALSYFKKWYELEKKKKNKNKNKDNKALMMLDECLENLADRYFTQKKYLEGFSMINSISKKWKDYQPCFDTTGIEEQEEKEIDDTLSKQLDDLAEKGNVLLENGNIDEALKVLQSAIDMIPEPKSEHEETVWFEASMGDVYFTKKAFNEAQILFGGALLNQSDESINPFILMRFGECVYENGDKKTAKRFLLQAYDLDGEKVFKSEEKNLKYLDFLLDEIKKDEEARKHPFKDFNFKKFWDDSNSSKKYVSEPPTDKLISEIEKELNYKLPASYIYLMKQHNGGIPRNTFFYIKDSLGYDYGYSQIKGIFGIGRKKANSLCGKYGSKFWINERDYPAIGVAICDVSSEYDYMIFLDYTECDTDDEPKVVLVHKDDEHNNEITYLAENFEEFIRELINEDEFEMIRM